MGTDSKQIKRMTMFENLETLKDDLDSYDIAEHKRNEEKIRDISKAGYLYFLITDAKCKIGITKKLSNRIQKHLTYISEQFTRIYVSELCTNFRLIENEFKALFKDYIIIGGEWFDSQRISSYIGFLNNVKYEFADNCKEVNDNEIDELIFNYFHSKDIEIAVRNYAYKQFFDRCVWLFLNISSETKRMIDLSNVKSFDDIVSNMTNIGNILSIGCEEIANMNILLSELDKHNIREDIYEKYKFGENLIDFSEIYFDSLKNEIDTFKENNNKNYNKE